MRERGAVAFASAAATPLGTRGTLVVCVGLAAIALLAYLAATRGTADRQP